MAQGIFITGTDTGAGKTVVSTILIRSLKEQGHIVHGMKPVASGCQRTAQGLISDDALMIQAAGSTLADYAEINPVALESACSPNFAAQIENRNINLDEVEQACRRMLQRDGLLMVEGIGGWRTPVFGQEGMVHLVRRLQIPVLLVVGLRLGCINHALLTHQALLADKVRFAGWISSQVDPEYTTSEKTVSCLSEVLGSHPIAMIPHVAAERMNSYKLNIDTAFLYPDKSV
jgi:dethiobiotin synthetase